jgi:hypothetical protein
MAIPYSRLVDAQFVVAAVRAARRWDNVVLADPELCVVESDEIGARAHADSIRETANLARDRRYWMEKHREAIPEFFRQGGTVAQVFNFLRRDRTEKKETARQWAAHNARKVVQETPAEGYW